MLGNYPFKTVYVVLCCVLQNKRTAHKNGSMASLRKPPLGRKYSVVKWNK